MMWHKAPPRASGRSSDRRLKGGRSQDWLPHFVLLLLSCTLSWAQTYTIAGIVKNESGHPAKRVRVAVANAESRENQTAMLTAEDGRFRFDGLAAGKYQLTAQPPAGGGQQYGTRSLSSGFGTSVATGPEFHSDNLVFQLGPPAAIAGRVLDSEGEPAENVLVQLFAARMLRGKRSVLYWGSRRTDDRGEYRFGGIADGTYYLAASGQPWYGNRLPGSTAPLAQMGFATTFFPNTREARSAQALRLKPGQELSADFALLASPAAKLTVTASGAPPGTPVLLDVRFEGVAGSKCWERTMWAYPPRLAEMPGIHPGTYTVRAQAKVGAAEIYGTQRVTIGNDQVSVAVPLSAPPVVAGKLWLEDVSAIPDGTYIELENEVENIHTRRPVAKDGTFQFEAMPPGQYRPLVGSPRKMIPLRSVTLDGALAKEEMVEIAADAKLELLGLVHGSAVSGTVTRLGDPLAGALALLAPRRESANPLDYRGFQTDSDGSFEFEGLAAGDYVLIVLEDWFDFEYANPAAVRPHLETGRAVHLESGQSQKIRLELK
jgi:5-hydroxyisourate hydrolase-like protein (transthyretin family)